MTIEEDIPIIRGPLKLKGGIPIGVVKKKKKKKPEKEKAQQTNSSGPSSVRSCEAETKLSTSMVQPESHQQQQCELNFKTATELAYEESRKRRVRFPLL